MNILQRLGTRLTRPALDVAVRSSDFPTLTFDEVAYWLTSGDVRFPVRQTMTGNVEAIDGSYGGYAASAYAGNGIVFACMQARFSLFSEARFQFRQVRSGRPGDLFGTPALAPLEAPWPGGTTGDLLSRLMVTADLGGNGFTVSNSMGGLRVIRPDWTTMVYGSPKADASATETELVALLYHDGGRATNTDPEVFVRGEFAHFAPTPDPLHPLKGVGMSWLTPVLREVRGDTGYTSHKLQFLENGATVNMVVTVGGNLNDKQFKDWVTAFEKSHKGAANAYKTLYLTAGTEAKAVGSDMAGMDFKAVQGAGETRIAAAAGVPPVVVGFSEGLQGSSLNAGNYSAARRRFADLTMRPLWRNVSGSLASLVTVPAGAELWYDDRDIAFLQEDVADAAAIQEKEALTIRQLVDAGFQPDAVVDAITAGDLKRLIGKHSGLYSVQLQEPGAIKPAPDPARSMTDLIIATRSEPRDPSPAIHIHQPPVTFEAGDVHVSPASVTVENRVEPTPVTVNTPDVRVDVQPSPVTVQTIPSPEVRVDVQAAPAPNVTVTTPDTLHIASMPARETRRKVTKRTDKGAIAEAVDIEQDATGDAG